MIYFTILVPLITCIILLIFYRKSVSLIEYGLIVIPSILFITLLNYVFISSRTSDTEYIGSYIVSIKYYEHWDEWITRRCSYTICSGSGKTRSCTTHYYDCSYREDHPRYWVMVTNDGNEIEISEDYYNYLKRLYNNVSVFVDMHRDYYRIDGDCYKNEWPQTIKTSRTITNEHTYVNKIQCSHSLFKIQDLTESEVKQWKLYNYPTIENHDQNLVLGVVLADSINKKFRYINGYYGNKYQIKTFVCVFKNQGVEVAYKQRSHWEGINKNEFLICIGVDSVDNKINWIKVFSWCERPTLEKSIEALTDENPTFNDVADELLKRIPSEWKRRSFKDFDYITVEITNTQLDIIIVILLIYNIGISIYVVMYDIFETFS
jgi:hypothetical protein